MKKILFYLIILTFVSCSLFERSRGGDLTLSGANLKDFNYTSIEGRLTIKGDWVTDISNLSSLKSVGAIDIVRTSLTNLNGLHNVREFTNGQGEIRLQENSDLVDVSALSRLSGSISLLRAQVNPILTDFRPLGIAEGGSIRIENSPITSLESFNLAPQMDKILLRSTFDLVNLNGLQQVAELNTFDISQSSLLMNLDAFSHFSRLDNLHLNHLPQLSNINGLNGLNISGTIVLHNLSALSSLDGLQSVTTLRHLYIRNLSSLHSLNGLNNLTEIGIGVEHFNIRAFTLDNIDITSLQGLDNLRAVRDINISDCDVLLSLDGAQLINNGSLDFARWIRIVRNAELRDFCGLTNYVNNSEFDVYEVSANGYNPIIEYVGDPSRCSN